MSFDPDSKTDDLVSAFVQDEIALMKDILKLTVGSKFEHNDYTGFEMQPSVRILWKTRDKHALWGAISRAVRTILSGVLFVSFLNIPSVRTLIIAGRQRLIAQLLAISVTFNVLLTILLIPNIGVFAVPLARVTSMALFWGLAHTYVNRQIVKSSLSQSMWRPMAALVCALVLTAVLNGTSVWVQALIGLSTYSAIILLLGGLSHDERQFLKPVLLHRRTSQELHIN